MPDLNVIMVQCELAWEDPAANRDALAAMLADSAAGADLVVLPEMFTTGFSMRSSEIAEENAADTLPWLRRIAADHQAAITGTIAVRDGGQYYNRLLWVTPEGELSVYDKRHLFRLSGEHEHYEPGNDRLVVEWRGWRFCPMICYDLRFPVWTRNRDDYDVVLFLANWPERRRAHWRSLLVARAIENQAYCIGVNRLGEDGNGLRYTGDSLAVAADGELLVDCGDQPGIFPATLSRAALANYREQLPFLLDADDFTLHTD